jgi:hypothetical protein
MSLPHGVAVAHFRRRRIVLFLIRFSLIVLSVEIPTAKSW